MNNEVLFLICSSKPMRDVTPSKFNKSTVTLILILKVDHLKCRCFFCNYKVVKQRTINYAMLTKDRRWSVCYQRNTASTNIVAHFLENNWTIWKQNNPPYRVMFFISMSAIIFIYIINFGSILFLTKPIRDLVKFWALPLKLGTREGWWSLLH